MAPVLCSSQMLNDATTSTVWGLVPEQFYSLITRRLVVQFHLPTESLQSAFTSNCSITPFRHTARRPWNLNRLKQRLWSASCPAAGATTRSLASFSLGHYSWHPKIMQEEAMRNYPSFGVPVRCRRSHTGPTKIRRITAKCRGDFRAGWLSASRCGTGDCDRECVQTGQRPIDWPMCTHVGVR